MNMTLEFGILDGLFLVFARYARSYVVLQCTLSAFDEGGRGNVILDTAVSGFLYAVFP